MKFLRAWIFTQIASWALLFQKRDLALAYFNKILERQPEHWVTMSRIAFIYAEAGERGRARAQLKRVLTVRPNDADSWFNLGYLHQEDGDHHAAINAFDQSVAVREGHDRAWFGKALSLMALGQFADAIVPLKKNVMLQPMSPHGHMELARVYFKLGDLDRCLKRMHRLKAFDPKSAAVLEDETGIRVGVDRWWAS